MSDDKRPIGLDWLLAYEELDATERQEANRYLTDHPELAAQIERIRDVERKALREIPTRANDGFWAEASLPAEDEASCRDSARRIRSRLGVPAASPSPRPWKRLPRNPRWLLPVAAVLALTVIGPQLARRNADLTGLAVETIAATSDGTRSADLTPLVAGTLSTGDAFVLAFELKADSYLAVVHVDPLGEVALVYPLDQARVTRLDGGRRHRLPDPDSDEMWILGGATGRESFVIATDREQAPSVSELQTSLAGDAGGRDRAAVLAAVRELLGATWDQVEVIEFSHVE